MTLEGLSHLTDALFALSVVWWAWVTEKRLKRLEEKK